MRAFTHDGLAQRRVALVLQLEKTLHYKDLHGPLHRRSAKPNKILESTHFVSVIDQHPLIFSNVSFNFFAFR